MGFIPYTLICIVGVSGGREEGKLEMHLLNFYLNILECVDLAVLGSVFENDGKMTFCRFVFLKRKTKRQVSALLVVLI